MVCEREPPSIDRSKSPTKGKVRMQHGSSAALSRNFSEKTLDRQDVGEIVPGANTASIQNDQTSSHLTQPIEFPKSTPLTRKSKPEPSNLTRNSVEFGKSSPLGRSLNNNHIFIPAKSRQPRPQRVSAASGGHSWTTSNDLSNQKVSNSIQASPTKEVKIPRPENPIILSTGPAGRKFFSSKDATIPFAAVNPVAINGNCVLFQSQGLVNSEKTDQFDPDKALKEDYFGAPDPNEYKTSDQATKDIKALLEGGIDDDEAIPVKLPKPSRERESSKPCEDLCSRLEKVKVQGNERDEEDGSVEGLSIKLLPHQVEGVAWMIDKESGRKRKDGVAPRGGILADDMGLGKTIQSIALMVTNPHPESKNLILPGSKSGKGCKIPRSVSKSTLIVAPMALVRQWESEIHEKVSPSHRMRICVHHGPNRTKCGAELKNYDVVITSYQTLVSEAAASDLNTNHGPRVGCFGVYWYRIILDEAHNIKNRRAKCSQAAYKLDGWFRWCLSGTPMQNNMDELQSLIQFLRIKPYCDIGIWQEHISTPMKNKRGNLAMRRLYYFLRAIMKRRTKAVLNPKDNPNFGRKQVTDGPDANTTGGFRMPEKIIETVKAEFTPSERIFYEKLSERVQTSLDEMRTATGHKTQKNYIGALMLLLRMRQACNHPQLVRGMGHKDVDMVSALEDSRSPVNPPGIYNESVDTAVELLGGLTLTTKLCDFCQRALGPELVKNGDIRCIECEKVVHTGTFVTIQEGSPDERDEDRSLWKDETEEEASHYKNKMGSEDLSGQKDQKGGVSSRSRDEDYTNSPGSFKGTSTKIRHLLSILAKTGEDEKTIVFSEFTSMLDLVQDQLKIYGFRFVRYDGKMRSELREASLRSLREDPRVRVLLCSLRSGGVGLNLTAANCVVMMEPFWNPFVEAQAIDRVHRIGQSRTVRVYRLTIPNTVEERILELQDRKTKLAEAAGLASGSEAKGTGSSSGLQTSMKLGLDEILKLFGSDADRDLEGPADDTGGGKKSGK